VAARLTRVLARVDHLVYATPNLEKSVAEMEARLGVRAAPGGRHPGRGTRNALIALSPSSYLEIVGPDADQPPTDTPRWFGIDTIATPRLVTWAARGDHLRDVADAAARLGVRLGPIAAGSRRRSDGTVLHWEFTDPTTVVGDGLVPFLIDWGDSPHPAASSPGGVALIALRGRHPEPAVIERQLSAVGIALPVERGTRPELVATLRTGGRDVELA
jgi:hypothetical protein